VYFQENGAAFEAGGLEVGQLILEVDGQKVEGKDFVERRFYTMEVIKQWVNQVRTSVHMSDGTTITF
jgi:C-terminal processing protease CtpA/Prc